MNTISLKDYADITATVNVYLEGGNVSGKAMQLAFHENATINGAPIQTLFDGVDKAGPTDAKGRIDILDVVNDIACVRVTMEGWHGSDFVDFHLLMKTGEGWKIVAKVFTDNK